MTKLITVVFEYTDAHMTNADDGILSKTVIDNCIKLCEVFDFDFKITYQKTETTPHLVFSVSFIYSLFTYQHYMNVLQAFASEHQILIAGIFESLAQAG